jgi:type I restriction enzyme S subunit
MSSKTKTTATKEEATPALVPKLRFPEFRNAEGWTERPLGEFLRESRLPGSKGNVAKKITVKLWGKGVFEKNDAIQGSINTQYFRRKAGQFIYSKLDFLNQAFGIIPPSLDNFESTVDLPCFDFAEGLNSVFLLEYVKRSDFYERLGETADGSRKARRIHAETFLSFPVALPTPAEQQKIAECLSSADDLITAQARKVDALKTHKKGLMQQLFPREGETQPRLRFPEFKGEWKDATLGDLCFSVSSGKDARDSDGAFNLYGSTGVIGKTLKASYDSPHILVARVGANAGYLTKASGQFGVTDNTLVVNLKPAASIDFIFHSLGNININKLIFGSGQPLITGSILKVQRVLVPSAAEQSKISDCLSSISDLIKAESDKLGVLNAHKKGLMQQLFPSTEEVVS